MSKQYTLKFKHDLEGLNEEIEKIIDGTLSEPPFKGQCQKQRIYELVCEYIDRNQELKIIDLFKNSENRNGL